MPRKPPQGGTGLSSRLDWAKRRWELLHAPEELDQTEIGRRVGAYLKAKPVKQTGVSRWFTGETEPSLKVICALADVLEVDPGWLAFGEDSKAPAPSMALPVPNGAYTPIERTKNGLAGDLVEGRQGVEG